MEINIEDINVNHGYVKLNRNLLYEEIIKKPYLLQIWIWCLLRVSYKRRKIRWGTATIELMAGQFITGRFAAESELGIPATTFRDRLKKIEKMEKIAIKSTNKYSIVTILKWGQMQSTSPTDSPKSATNKKGEQKNKNGFANTNHLQTEEEQIIDEMKNEAKMRISNERNNQI